MREWGLDWVVFDRARLHFMGVMRACAGFYAVDGNSEPTEKQI